MTAADKMKAEALAVFGGLEYPELARDVIEWFHASMLVQQEQAGWQLVPVEPTEAMCIAAVKFANGPAVYKNVAAEALKIEESIYSETYQAMLAAAPKGEKP